MAPTTDVQMSDSAVPAANPTIGPPAHVDGARDLRAEREAEAARERAEAQKKANRFMARKMTVADRPVAAAPEYESYVLESAVNNPLQDLKNPSQSTFVPHLGTIFYILMSMDHIMAGTKRWTDNCLGWVPPLSQMYIAILAYYQIIRAMDCAGSLPPGSELKIFLETFETIFPLSELYVPGPLVLAFRSLAAFWPSASDRFGNVHPTLPTLPGWNNGQRYSLGNLAGQTVPQFHLPNISLFITRLRQICATAVTANMTQQNFSAHLDGPFAISHIFQVAVNHGGWEQALLAGPGAKYLYPDQLPLWQNASARLGALAIPNDLDLNVPTVVNDNWISFFRFDNNQHVWFGNVAAVMVKYCQFFNGSKPMSELLPNNSAAGALKLRITAASTLEATPTWHAAVAAAAGPPAVAAVAAHYTTLPSSRIVLDAQLALEDVPDAHIYAAMTFGLNAFSSNARQVAGRLGTFWTLGPDVGSRNGIETTPGVLATITRKYHSDVRITADRQ